MPKPKRRASRGEQTIITFHGIWSDGRWQESFEAVFGAHFHYESFKYSEYRDYLGPIFFLGLEWVAMLLLLVGIIVEWERGWLGVWWLPWIATVFCVASILLLARSVAEARRRRVVSDFVNFVDEAVASGSPPHVMAHSLGSFVLGRTLLRFPEFKVAKVVLLGCVLNPKFTWAHYAGSSKSCATSWDRTTGWALSQRPLHPLSPSWVPRGSGALLILRVR